MRPRRYREEAQADQLALDLLKDEAARRGQEQAQTDRAATDAYRWRLQIVLTEAVMMGALVAIAGLALRQPLVMVLRAAAMVSAASLASGLILLSVSSRLVALMRRLHKADRS